jgi:hypothetical protein
MQLPSYAKSRIQESMAVINDRKTLHVLGNAVLSSADTMYGNVDAIIGVSFIKTSLRRAEHLYLKTPQLSFSYKTVSK